MKKAWDPDRWQFSVDEVANLCWHAIADDQQGTTLSRWGYADGPEEILQLVKDEAAEITRRRREAAAR